MPDILKGKFYLAVPLDASEVEEFDPEKKLKVVLRDKKGKNYSKIITMGKDAKEIVRFEFDQNPGALQLMVGPDDVDDEEMYGLDTLTLSIPLSQWMNKPKLELPRIKIPSYYWRWWLIWCRWFTITGHLLTPDGCPIPDATVCAYDVDWWWWWHSRQQVGCAVTDHNGYFTIKFRWCCGWRPWWWWYHHHWVLDTDMAEHILKALQKVPGLTNIPRPQPKPDLRIFEKLLGDNSYLIPPSARKKSIAALGNELPTILSEIQKPLQQKLPLIPELEKYHIWPWWPWWPWRDCTPDINFKVTQFCEVKEKVILNEGWLDTRWNISTNTHVNLYTTEGCPINCGEEPEGNCLLLTHACSSTLDSIGGNLDAPLTPIGYYNPANLADPASFSNSNDRPFAGSVSIWGEFGDGADADYYEFEYFDTGTGNWEPLPPGSCSGFSRSYFGPPLGGPLVPPYHTYYVSFPLESIDGKSVIKTRRYFETLNGFNIGATHWWMNNKDLLLLWNTETYFANGTYKLRAKSYKLVGGHLVASAISPQVLHQCGTENDNNIVLTTDNRVLTGSPDAAGHACGSGTVHVCTSEPESAFISIKIIHPDGTESQITPCSENQINDTDTLQVDFAAHDPEGHLMQYTLHSNYGENLTIDLLDSSLDAWSLTSGTPVSYAPAAVQVGPGYGAALGQGATSPHWYGGTIRLSVKAREAFPQTCCYMLKLYTYKRNIVSCHYSDSIYSNYSEYSFLVRVP